MKKPLILTSLAVAILSTCVYGLSFSENTMFLDASNKTKCEKIGGSFLAWADEAYCTAMPEDFLSKKKIKTIEKVADKIVSIVSKDVTLYEQVEEGLYSYEEKLSKKGDLEKLATLKYLVETLKKQVPEVADYKECKKLGGNIMESYPQQCSVLGQNFTEIINDNEVETKNNVQFMGKITKIVDGKDGSEIILEGVDIDEGKIVTTILSIPNLGIDNQFDFSDIALENIISVYGEQWLLGNEIHITPSYAMTIYSEKQEKQCKKEGGDYGNFGGFSLANMCNKKTPDAGKSCSNSSDCTTFCMSKTKTCGTHTATFGCQDIIEDGKEVTICID